MIRVTIELESAVTHKSTVFGMMCIANDGSGTKKLGNYKAVVYRKGHFHRGWGRMPTQFTRQGSVTDYPRLSYNVWRLIIRALLSCFPEEKSNA